MRIKYMSVSLLVALVSCASLAQEPTGTLKKIRDSNTITLGYREAAIPFSYLNDKQQPIGYAMDICARIVDDIKAQLKQPGVVVKTSAVNELSKTLLVANNTIDLECGASINNLTQQKQFGFSPAIFLSNAKIVAKKSAKIKSGKDLSNKTVVVVDGSPYERAIKAIAEKEKISVKFLYAKDEAEALATLTADRAPAAVLDNLQIKQQILKSKNAKEFEVLADDLGVAAISLVYRKNDNEFGALVNRTFVRLIQSGEMQKIYDWWFVQKLPDARNAGNALGMPMSAALKAAMQLQVLPE